MDVECWVFDFFLPQSLRGYEGRGEGPRKGMSSSPSTSFVHHRGDKGYLCYIPPHLLPPPAADCADAFSLPMTSGRFQTKETPGRKKKTKNPCARRS